MGPRSKLASPDVPPAARGRRARGTEFLRSRVKRGLPAERGPPPSRRQPRSHPVVERTARSPIQRHFPARPETGLKSGPAGRPVATWTLRHAGLCRWGFRVGRMRGGFGAGPLTDRAPGLGRGPGERATGRTRCPLSSPVRASRFNGPSPFVCVFAMQIRECGPSPCPRF